MQKPDEEQTIVEAPPGDGSGSLENLRHASRRDVMVATAAIIAGTASVARASERRSTSASSTTAWNDAQSPIFHTCEISSGKVQGMTNGPVWEFKGIPYGASTSGQNRFMPPRLPLAWKGIRECFAFGQTAPQLIPALPLGSFIDDYVQVSAFDRQDGSGIGEDCLSLNIWTPKPDRNSKKAVLVSLHGGGFFTGSGGASIYDDKSLANFGDVVVVTLNHRLASLGYVNLSSVGAPDQFRYAGIAGMMDLVLALQWIRDNIEEFGGDPSRVMIFGNSSGGWKVTALMAMPGAKGLFHRAAVQSGSPLRMMTPEQGAPIAAAFVSQLGLTKANISDIQKLPWKQVLSAQLAVGPAGFQPMIGTDVLPTQPFDPLAPEISAHVPMIISTALEDQGINIPGVAPDDAGLASSLDKRFPGRGAEILALYRRIDPVSRPFQIEAQAVTDSSWRRDAQTQASRKADQLAAPVWMYQWNWRTPAYEGEFGAIHGSDIPASFHSYRDGFFNGSTAGKLMVNRLSSAWVAFAKTGDPNNPSLPPWQAFDSANRATMIFDNQTRVENDPRREIRAYWDAHPPLQHSPD